MAYTVIAAVIVKDNQVLVTRRALGQSNAGQWEFPGGKLEVGESERDCLVRELDEELGIAGEVGDWVGESRHRYAHGEIALKAYYFDWQAGEISLRVHDNMRFVKADALLGLNMTPADRPLAERVAAQLAT